MTHHDDSDVIKIKVTDAHIERVIDQQNLYGYANLIHAINVEHGFWEADRNFGETLALMHSELSEALEEHRSAKPLAYIENGKPEGQAVELLDCLIRILDWFGAHKEQLEAIDLGVTIGEFESPATASLMTLFELKLKYNNSRPYKHGRQY